MQRTITRLFDSHADAVQAVNELERIGIPHEAIGVMSKDRKGWAEPRSFAQEHQHGDPAMKGAGAGAAVGGAVGGGAALLAGMGALAIPGMGPVVAAGFLATAIAGATVGAMTGGVLGLLAEAGHTEEEAHALAEGVRRGGALVSVRASDADANEVEAILSRYGGVDAATRGAEYREAGWTGFDEKAPPYESDEVEPRPGFGPAMI